MTQTAERVEQKQSVARTFLPEIQALRTVAVMIVVLYHVWPTYLPGGFVGVDVFFAISGFLITAHLLRELTSTGRVKVARFWGRRVRRLLPAAFTVLVACALFTLFVLPEVVRVETLRQIAGSAAYIENWLLANDSVDYLASANDPTIVQHYWSLSVEEQFYLLWPLLLLAATGIAALAAKRSSRAIVTTVGITTVAVIVGSLAFSIFLTWFSPSVAYFHTATRAWEFALGALVAVVVAARPDLVERFRATGFVRSGALTLLGLAAIGASVLVITGASPFPGYIALLPVLGAIAIMGAGMPDWRPLAAVIAWRPVQYTGDISYSIYLWHWPLIVGFAAVAGRPVSGIWGVAIVVASFVLAGLTKVFVEDPGRRTRLLAKPLAAIAFAVVGALVFIGLAVGVTTSTLARVEAHQRAVEEAVTNPTDCFGASATLSGADCTDPFELTDDVDLTLAANDLAYQNWCLTWHDQEWASCEFGETANPKGTIALVGDSHAASMVQAFDEYFKTNGWRVVTMTRFGCSGLNYEIVGADYTSEAGRQEYDCRVWTQRVNAELTARTDIDAVVYTNYSSSYIAPERNEPYTLKVDDIQRTWADVIASGKKVIVFKDPPRTMGDNVPQCLVGHAGETGPCSTERADSVRWDPMDDAAKLFDEGVTTIDMTDAFCDDERCYAVIGGVVAYADHNHISGTFSRTMMPYLGPLILEGTS